MSAKSKQQTLHASQPNFCANCGTRFPRLNSQQLARHRFCSCCGELVTYGRHKWLPVTLDEATGTLLHADLPLVRGASDSTIKQRLENLGRHPGKMIATGTGVIVIGGGLILAAKTEDRQAVGSVFKVVGMVAAAGLATAVVGGIIGFFAALLPLVGGILVGVGAVATTGIIGHQAYLHYQQRLEIQKILETSVDSLRLGQ